MLGKELEKKVNKGGFFFNLICIRNLRKCCIYAGDSIFDIEALKNVGVVFMNGYLQHITILLLLN